MKRYLPALGIVLVAGLTALSGYIQGRMSNRWGPPADMLAAAKKLEEVPTKIGDWRVVREKELDEPVVEVLQCAGYLARDYQKIGTERIVTVAVLLGPAGPISVHTPDVCYSSQHYTPTTDPSRVSVAVSGGRAREFWHQTFEDRRDRTKLSVYHGWNAGDGWAAPGQPRFTYADRPLLYKIQTAAEIESNATDPTEEFLEEFLPAAEPCLTRGSSN
ncbi:MAG: exosortase-associated EpsI family protein [Planctomycetota bacterium]|jgi:hypothetical protein